MIHLFRSFGRKWCRTALNPLNLRRDEVLLNRGCGEPWRRGMPTEPEQLLTAWREHGDLDARRQLIEQHLPLVRVLASRFVRQGEQLDDLVQIGAVGLIKAVDRYDPTRG